MTTSRYHRRPRHRIRLRPCPTFPQLRQLTIGTIWCNGTATPWIRIRGHWLRQAGFHPQGRVRVIVTCGRLVIEPTPAVGQPEK